MEFRLSKAIYKDICIKEEHELLGWGLVSTPVSLSMLRYTVAGNAFSSDLETNESENVPTRGNPVAPW